MVRSTGRQALGSVAQNEVSLSILSKGTCVDLLDRLHNSQCRISLSVTYLFIASSVCRSSSIFLVQAQSITAGFLLFSQSSHDSQSTLIY